jgi:hypothetical protein
MDVVTAARLYGIGRAVVGALLLAAPRTVARPWIGAVADQPAALPVIRALGVRDLLLGFLCAHTAGREGVGARTMEACGAVDAVDLAATLAVRRRLPGTASVVVAVAAGGAATGVVLGRLLPR